MNDGDGVTKSYRLVYLSRHPVRSKLHRCQVYDSSARVWTMDKELDFGRLELHLEHPVICDDVVFWASSHSFSNERIDQYVVAFDVRKERTQIIPLPKSSRRLLGHDRNRHAGGEVAVPNALRNVYLGDRTVAAEEDKRRSARMGEGA
ncbi:unnamed protein product [Musa banksii]